MAQKPNYRILLEDRNWNIGISEDPAALPEILERKGDQLTIKSGNTHYRARILMEDHASKRYEIAINGRQFTLQLQTPLDVMIAEMGLNRSTRKSSNALIAPMPGMVLEIKVHEGDTVEEGSTLLILEAMKMENVLKGTASGIVKKVLVEKGEAVEKGQALIEFE